jgi:hypothetical protein
VQNAHLPLDHARLKGTLFEMGGVGQFSGVEEFWFDSLTDLHKLRQDPSIYSALTASEATFVDASASFSMVTMERVIYDFTQPAGHKHGNPIGAIQLAPQTWSDGTRQNLCIRFEDLAEVPADGKQYTVYEHCMVVAGLGIGRKA